MSFTNHVGEDKTRRYLSSAKSTASVPAGTNHKKDTKTQERCRPPHVFGRRCRTCQDGFITHRNSRGPLILTMGQRLAVLQAANMKHHRLILAEISFYRLPDAVYHESLRTSCNEPIIVHSKHGGVYRPIGVVCDSGSLSRLIRLQNIAVNKSALSVYLYVNKCKYAFFRDTNAEIGSAYF
jgi:hypothetical protein